MNWTRKGVRAQSMPNQPLVGRTPLAPGSEGRWLGFGSFLTHRTGHRSLLRCGPDSRFGQRREASGIVRNTRACSPHDSKSTNASSSANARRPPAPRRSPRPGQAVRAAESPRPLPRKARRSRARHSGFWAWTGPSPLAGPVHAQNPSHCPRVSALFHLCQARVRRTLIPSRATWERALRNTSSTHTEPREREARPRPSSIPNRSSGSPGGDERPTQRAGPRFNPRPVTASLHRSSATRK